MFFIAAAMSARAVNVDSGVFQNCAKVCINRAVSVPDCAFPDIAALKNQLADLQKKQAEMITNAQCDAKITMARREASFAASSAATPPANTATATSAAAPAATPAAAPKLSDAECNAKKIVYIGFTIGQRFAKDAKVKCNNATFGDPAPGKQKFCWIAGQQNRIAESLDFTMPFAGNVFYGEAAAARYLTDAEMKRTDGGNGKMGCLRDNFRTSTGAPAKDWLKVIPEGKARCTDGEGVILGEENTNFDIPKFPEGC